MTRILIVDDEDSIREDLRSLFSSRGYDCIEASGYQDFCNIIESIEYGEQSAVDLILLDHQLPPFCGWDLLAEVRQQYGEDCCRCKFVVCTANPDVRLNNRYQLLGSLNHIVKPYGTGIHAFWNTIEAALIDPRREFYQGYSYWDTLSASQQQDLRYRELTQAISFKDYDSLFKAATKWSIYNAEKGDFNEIENILNSLKGMIRDSELSNTSNIEKYFDVYESLVPYLSRSETLRNVVIGQYLDFGYRAIDNFYFNNELPSEIIQSIRLFLHEYLPDAERELTAKLNEKQEIRNSINQSSPISSDLSGSLLSIGEYWIGLAGGDLDVRLGIISYFSNLVNVNFIEVPASNEARVTTNYVRDRLQRCDLIVLITSYMGHDLYRNIRSLCKTGQLKADILIPNFRGSSGITREIKEKMLY